MKSLRFALFVDWVNNAFMTLLLGNRHKLTVAGDEDVLETQGVIKTEK